MPRIRIELPAHFPFSTSITLLISHINLGRHLDNAQLIGLVSEARVRFLKSMGYTELDVDGAGVIVADAGVQYRSEAFHGETMQVQLAPTDFNRYGFDLAFQLREPSTGREVARGKQGIVFIDVAEKKVASVPEAFQARLAARGTL